MASPMNGGDGTHSYSKNSTLQRCGLSAVEDAIKEAVMQNVETDKLLCGSTRFAIADLGCSVGPNTFHAVETIIEAVQHKSSTNNLEFQVLFNDQIGNDFNTLFASLPQERNYFAAAVAGSFYGRLFPSSSIHIAYSSGALHWLSKLPEGLKVKDSPAWNAGRIHYSGASDAVVKAYAEQLEEDLENFLRCRAQEIVGGGMIVILVGGVSHANVQHRSTVLFTFVEAILIDMVKEGVLAQEVVDSFNIPIVYACINDVRRIVEKNGCFEIVKMEMVEPVDIATAETNVVMHLRAAMEGTLIDHFGEEITEQVLVRAMRLPTHMMVDAAHGGGIFALLKRK
ncbi:loganic acid O-methyltransferase-like [Salvia miltiorrhiza]|uniref:loganic acid O-methyltransferase-like n=1 Tax=Salvia miltiorrhiza TaxID=226208 RepID=UPI0025ACC63A|nr:loganic acid O-methyltransferase-like [Salvia miltiorrhiza]